MKRLGTPYSFKIEPVLLYSRRITSLRFRPNIIYEEETLTNFVTQLQLHAADRMQSSYAIFLRTSMKFRRFDESCESSSLVSLRARK